MFFMLYYLSVRLRCQWGTGKGIQIDFFDRGNSDSQGSSLPEILNKTRASSLVLDFFDSFF